MMNDFRRMSTMLFLWLAAWHSAVCAVPRGTYGPDYSQVKTTRRSLQYNMDDTTSTTRRMTAPPTLSPTVSPQPSVSPAPSISTAPTLSGFSINMDDGRSTLSAVCSTNFATVTAASSTTPALSQQVFQFQYYMYTNADKAQKVAEVDRRYVQPLAARFLDCSNSRGDYNFTVQGIVATVHDGSDAIACRSDADGTACILGVGYFTALVKNPRTPSRRRERRQLVGQDLSDPDLIIAFGGVLATLFAGTELLDDEIKSLDFDGFINGFSPGDNDDEGPAGLGGYPGIDGVGQSSVADSDDSGLLLPVAASAAAGVVALALIALVVGMRRGRRRTADTEGFHDLDSGSWDFEADKPNHDELIQEQSLDALRDLRKLETPIRPKLDFEVDNANNMLGYSDVHDEIPSDEETENPPLALPSYLRVQRKNSPWLYDVTDLESTRSDLTPNTVDL